MSERSAGCQPGAPAQDRGVPAGSAWSRRVPQHRFGAVQRIQQPGTDIGHGKISHPFITLATMAIRRVRARSWVSSCSSCVQPAAALDLQQRREKRLADKHCTLRVTLSQANKRTGQVIAVVLMGETEGHPLTAICRVVIPELWLRTSRQRCRKRDRPFGHLRFQTVAAISPASGAAPARSPPAGRRPVICGRQRIGIVRITIVPL